MPKKNPHDDAVTPYLDTMRNLQLYMMQISSALRAIVEPLQELQRIVNASEERVAKLEARFAALERGLRHERRG